MHAQEALEIAEDKGDQTFRWNDVDFELMEKLARCSDETSAIVSRLAIGNLYGCVAIFSSTNIGVAERLENKSERRHIEGELTKAVRLHGRSAFRNAMLALHVIKDVDKTERQLSIKTTDGGTMSIGRSSRRVLIGVFFKNVGLSQSSLKEGAVIESGIGACVRQVLAERLGDESLAEQELYAERSA